uniref:Uncharacterized protein n=1 Tax=Rhizophora mucronata TaxID=61149 RepID=A0A2P2QC40_RHIMU
MEFDRMTLERSSMMDLSDIWYSYF